MKKIEFLIGDNSMVIFKPVSARLNIRGLMAFEVSLSGADLEFISRFFYSLSDGERGFDDAGNEGKSFDFDLSVDDSVNLPSETTFLQIRYETEIEDNCAPIFFNLSEGLLTAFWEEKGGKIADEAAKLEADGIHSGAYKNFLTLAVVINALRFVSGEEADFASVLKAWAAAYDQKVEVVFPSIRPLAA